MELPQHFPPPLLLPSGKTLLLTNLVVDIISKYPGVGLSLNQGSIFDEDGEKENDHGGVNFTLSPKSPS